MFRYAKPRFTRNDATSLVQRHWCNVTSATSLVQRHWLPTITFLKATKPLIYCIWASNIYKAVSYLRSLHFKKRIILNLLFVIYFAELNPCEPNPCGHNSQCIILPGFGKNHECNCSIGWSGETCQSEYNALDSMCIFIGHCRWSIRGQMHK